LQRIIVIHGMPTIEARTMVALVKRHGYRIWTESTSDTSVTVMGVSLDGQAEVATWTIDRARQAGYVPEPINDQSKKRPGVVEDWVHTTRDGGKKSVTGNMKYITDPQAMLYAKAAAEVCRKLAPDVLLGIAYTTEDVQSEQSFDAAQAPGRRDRVKAGRGGRGVDALRQRAAAAAERQDPVDAETVEPEQDQAAQSSAGGDKAMAPATRRKWVNRMFQLLNQFDVKEDHDQLVLIAALAGRSVNPLGLEHRDGVTDDELRRVVTALNEWDKSGTAEAQVREVLNAAALAESEGQ
jgi:hypothetical protein